jgi:hypothetical protein
MGKEHRIPLILLLSLLFYVSRAYVPLFLCASQLKNQSNMQQVKSKNPFLQNFFYPFCYNDLAKTAPPKRPYFSPQPRIFALFREGGIISNRYEKTKQ